VPYFSRVILSSCSALELSYLLLGHGPDIVIHVVRGFVLGPALVLDVDLAA
jgi:hypothetical protein